MADENKTEHEDEDEASEGGDGGERAAADGADAGDSDEGDSDEGDSDESDSDEGDSDEGGADDGEGSGAKAEAGTAAADDLARRERLEAEAAAREAAEEAEHPAAASITSLLGIERWVQFAFIAIGVILFFLVDNLVRFVWSQFGEPDGSIVSATAAASAVLGAFALYRHAQVNQLATEVITELKDVTWPTQDEVYYSTVVVIVTSVVAAAYTGLFDAMWSALTNVVYG